MRGASKPIGSLVPASRSRNKTDCYSQANLHNYSKPRSRRNFDASFNSRKESASSLLNKTANNSFSLKASFGRRPSHIGTNKLSKSMALSKHIGQINETKESSELEAKNEDLRSSKDANQQSQRYQAQINCLQRK